MGGGWEGRLHKCGRRIYAGRLTFKMAGDGVEWGWEGRRAGKEKTLTELKGKGLRNEKERRKEC